MVLLDLFIINEFEAQLGEIIGPLLVMSCKGHKITSDWTHAEPFRNNTKCLRHCSCCLDKHCNAM